MKKEPKHINDHIEEFSKTKLFDLDVKVNPTTIIRLEITDHD